MLTFIVRTPLIGSLTFDLLLGMPVPGSPLARAAGHFSILLLAARPATRLSNEAATFSKAARAWEGWPPIASCSGFALFDQNHGSGRNDDLGIDDRVLKWFIQIIRGQNAFPTALRG